MFGLFQWFKAGPSIGWKPWGTIPLMVYRFLPWKAFNNKRK